MEAIAVGGQVLGGFAAIQQGRAQQDMYNAQAKQAEMQARNQVLQNRAEVLNHKRQGIEVLKKISQNLASINARAAAGSIDPFSGSVQNLAVYNLGKGVTDFYTSRENQMIMQAQSSVIEAGGQMQAAQYQMAGKLAKQQGYINAIASFSGAASDAKQFGMFGG